MISREASVWGWGNGAELTRFQIPNDPDLPLAIQADPLGSEGLLESEQWGYFAGAVDGERLVIPIDPADPNSRRSREVRADRATEVVSRLIDTLAHGSDDVRREYDRTVGCLLYTSPSPRDATLSRMPSSA